MKDDPSEYVRRSVANNLNDISKDHPDAVIALCRRWQKVPTSGKQWIIRHATRTLVKGGHPEVFVLLGYTKNPRIKLSNLELDSDPVNLGETLVFKVKLQSTSPQAQTMVVDYAVHHMKANGITSPKIFKFRTVNIAPGATVVLTKRHAIKPVTTRKYHPGEHAIEILVNGKPLGRANFTLCIP